MKFKKTKTSIIAFAETKEDLKGTTMKIGDKMGTINLKTGKFVGATACMIKLHKEQEKAKLGNTKTSFKVWLTIEKQELNTKTGKETFTDLETETCSAGIFDTLEEAFKQIEEIGETFEGDFRSDENRF